MAIPFSARPKLGWRWKIDQLPSVVAEDQAPFHDYLSIGVKFEDGQDLTYIWSAALPAGKVFRCPLAGWNNVETHMIVGSGADRTGSWRAFERDVAADCAAHIGGEAKGITDIWLLAITAFQRRRGACRYADINIRTTDGAALNLKSKPEDAPSTFSRHLVASDALSIAYPHLRSDAKRSRIRQSSASN